MDSSYPVVSTIISNLFGSRGQDVLRFTKIFLFAFTEFSQLTDKYLSMPGMNWLVQKSIVDDQNGPVHYFYRTVIVTDR